MLARTSLLSFCALGLATVAAAVAVADPVAPPSSAGANLAVIPVPKLENDSYDWYQRHEAELALHARLDPEIVLIGDSITHFWGGEPASPGLRPRGPHAWASVFGDRPVANLGFGWDRTQNVLWRLAHGELEGYHPRWIVLNIGTNNFTGTKNARASTAEETAAGVGEIIRRLRVQAPQAQIVLMAVFPRDRSPVSALRRSILDLNGRLQKEWANQPGIIYLDLTAKFLQSDGVLPPEMMSDGVHPTEYGYQIWADALQSVMHP